MQTTNEFVISPSPEDAAVVGEEIERKQKGIVVEERDELKLPPISTRRVDDQHPPAAATQFSRKIRQDIFQ